MIRTTRKTTFSVVLIVSLFLAYLPLFLAPRRENPDAAIIWGNLDQFQNLLSYFQGMVNLKTIDLQPVRDLTIWIDKFFWKSFHLDTSIFQNLFFWTLAMFSLLKITEKLFPEMNERARYAGILLFSQWPLFSATLSWGIARKHILAFLFLLEAYRALLDQRWAKSTAFYCLSVLSHPIAILFPLWALIKNRILPLAAMLMMAAMFIFIESAYYNQSETFRMLYESKTGALDPVAVILATGHYFFRLLIPLSPANSYDLFHPGIYAGLLILLLSAFFTIRKAKENLIWWTAIFFPLVPVLRSPEMLSDTYLLLPAVFFLFLFFRELQDRPRILIPLFIAFMAINFYESSLWTKREDYYGTRNFERRPGCNSAIRSALIEFQETSGIRDEVKNYLGSFDCRDMGEMTFAKTLISLQLQSAIIYSDSISYEEKKLLLEKIMNLYYFPKLALAALALKNQDTEYGLSLVNEIGLRHDQILWDDGYLNFVAVEIAPKCGDDLCRKVTGHFVKRSDKPFF